MFVCMCIYLCVCVCQYFVADNAGERTEQWKKKIMCLVIYTY